MTDEQIIALYWQRDERAIRESQKKYGAYCHGVAQNILHSTQDAEECLNDTWLRAWDAIPPQRPARLRMFFAAITRNLAFDRFKARSAQKRGGGELTLILDELEQCVDGRFDPETEAAAAELEQSIGSFLRALPARERGVFIRRYFFAESAAQIAKRFGLSAGHTAVLLSRTRKTLRAHLQKEGFIP